MMRTNFNLNQFKKIEDIIFIDEPILSHLKLDNIDYLLYLVETTHNSDISLLLEVGENEVFNYVTGRESLRNTLNNNKKLIIVLEQNFTGEIIETYFLRACQLDQDYLPSEDSFLILEPIINSYYYNLIKEYESKYYLETLRSNAFYLKFSPVNKKYGSTLGLKEISENFLEKISSSFTSFLKIEFKKQFENQILDKTNLLTTINKLVPDLDFRMVDLNYGSFEIGLAIDDLMKNGIEDKKIKDWAKKVANNYKKIVLDEVITKEETEEIIKNYTDDERIKIFKPIIEITTNPNFEFKIKNKKLDQYKSIGLKNKKVAKEIISRQTAPTVAEEQNLGLVQFTAIINKNDKKKSIKIEDTLFTQVDEAIYTLRASDFQKYNYKKIPSDIKVNLVLEQFGNNIILKCNFDNEDFSILLKDIKIEDGIKKITENIYEYYINTLEK